jgi:hypothetical protein
VVSPERRHVTEVQGHAVSVNHVRMSARVDPASSIPRVQMAAYGASRPLRRIPALVSFLNPQPALSLVGGNRSSCPKGDLRDSPESRRHCVEAA